MALMVLLVLDLMLCCACLPSGSEFNRRIVQNAEQAAFSLCESMEPVGDDAGFKQCGLPAICPMHLNAAGLLNSARPAFLASHAPHLACGWRMPLLN